MQQITAKELEAKLLNGENISIIDVRETAEVAAGKIPTAINIPLRLIAYKMSDLIKKQPYFLVCLSGARSAQATLFLESHGFEATNLEGGMLAWSGELEF